MTRRHIGWILLPLAVACDQGELNLEVESQLTDASAPYYAHAAEYLTRHQRLERVTATLTCPDDPASCLLRIDAEQAVSSGPSSALILYVAMGVQPLPGLVDLSGVYQYGLEPVSYATLEAVGADDIAKRYDYTCTWTGGWLSLDELPTAGEWLSGDFELELDCVPFEGPDEHVPALARGTFLTPVEDAL